MGSIGAYLRVSSRSQSVATQRVTIEQVAKNRGDTVGTWWLETESAKKLDRPVLGTVREAAKMGQIKRLYVYKLDRLSRSGIRDTLAVLEEFESRGVQVVSIADPFDLASPLAPVIVSVLAWAAEQERRVLGERIADSRKRIEAQGKHWGRPATAIPADMLRRAAALVAEGRSERGVAHQLGVDRTTLHRNLKKLTHSDVAKRSAKIEPVTPGNYIAAKGRL